MKGVIPLKSVIVILVIGFLACLGTRDSKANCDHSGTPSPVGESTADCWACCLEYLCAQYSWSFVTQGDFGYYACAKLPLNACYYPYKALYGCNYCQFNNCMCGISIGDLNSIMPPAGFQSCTYYHGALTPDGLEGIICNTSTTYLVGCYDENAHAVVAVGYSEGGPGVDDDIVIWMDPLYSNLRATTFNAFCYPTEYGTLQAEISTTGFIMSSDFLNYVSVADIQSFHAHLNGSTVRLDFEISAGANPNDEAAVYISDNALGPGKLIPTLIGAVVLMPDTNTWYHTPISGSRYYYFLDHGTGFSDDRSTAELKAASENPIYHSTGRPVYGAPSNINVTDNTIDRGTSLSVTWQLSQNDNVLDCYHIYRKKSPDISEGTFEYLTSVPKGTSAFLDNSVDIFNYYTYKISSAHHGNYSGTLTYQYGLYNDFSTATAPCKPIDELYQVVLSFPSARYDTLLVCPAGDADTLRAKMTITGSNGNPPPSINAQNMFIYILSQDSVFTCSGSHRVAAQHNTDASGTTEFAYPFLAGCGSLTLIGGVLSRGTDNVLGVRVKTCDLNLNGHVDLNDFSILGIAWQKHCGQPGYNDCADYNFDCIVNLSDLVFFGDHYQDYCP